MASKSAMMSNAMCLACLVLLACFSCVGGVCIQNTSFPGRLPLSIIPSHYNLHLNLMAPDEPQLDFDGVTYIDVEVVADTTCVVLHAASSIQISEFSAIKEGSTIRSISSIYDARTEMYTANFATSLLTYNKLQITYRGLVRTNGRGLFKSDNQYQPLVAGSGDIETGDYSMPIAESLSNVSSAPRNSSNAVPQMYATQFERSDARAAFPCFDEPALKATFEATISAISPADQYTILFNTPMISSSYDGSKVTAVFESTIMKMSTYLVALAVGHFDFVQRTSASGTLFRIFTPRGQSSWSEFALNVSVYIVDYFERTCEFSYTRMNKKLDQIAVAGRVRNAMENMGLCTYSPGYLMCDPNNCALGDYQKIALVVTHEISHQWFGDTITAPWWSSLYLNEGFARYLQYTGVQYLHPEWDIFNTVNEGPVGPVSYYLNTYVRAMRADYLGLAPPIVVPETSNQNTNGQIFYEKGACVNSMVADYIGADDWNKAFAYEMNEFTFENPSVTDMLNSVGRFNASIPSRMRPWLETAGFPVIIVSLDVETGILTLQQKPITATVWSQPPPTWWLPLHVTGKKDGREESFFFNFANQTHTYRFSEPGQWDIRVDPKFLTFSIPVYSYWQGVWDEIMDPATAPYWRFVNLQTGFFLARTGWVTSTHISQLISTIGFVTSRISTIPEAAQAIISLQENILGLIPLFASIPDEKYNAFLTSLGTSIEETTFVAGLSGGNATMSQLRTASFNLAILANLPSATGNLLELFTRDPALVPLDLQAASYQAAATRGLGSDITALFDLYRSTPAGPQHNNVVSGLSAVKTAALCSEVISLLSANSVDWANGVQSMLRINRVCRAAAWTAVVNDAERAWSGTCVPATTTAILARLQSAGASDEDLIDIYRLLALPSGCVNGDQKAALLHAFAINRHVARTNS